jgi:hypothetical protein
MCRASWPGTSVERKVVEHASGRRKPASKLKKALRALFVALAITGTAVGAAACGPSHHHSNNNGPGGY